MREQKKKNWRSAAARAAIVITAVLCCAMGFHGSSNTASAVNGYIYEEGDTVTFKITQKIGTFYKDTMSTYPSFTMKDTIPAGLSYVSGSVVDSTGASYGAPAYNQSTREVSFTRPASWLASEANYKGQTFTMTINCKALQPQTTTDVIKNIAYTSIGSLSYATNQVSLSVVKPDLSVTKISDKNVYHSGETSKWTITVTQPIANATADNVIITEENLPAGLVIDMNTVKASDAAAAVEKGTNSFKVTVPHLAGGKSVTVSFNASFDAGRLKSSSVVNTADAASVTGSTDISKKATKEISVKNSITTEIENGSITDAIKDIEIGGERTVEYAPNEGYYIQKVIADGEEVKAEDPYEGSYTFSDIRKNHSIRVICGLIPNLEILKETDKEQYHSGQTVKYCIKARQTVEGAVAKNIVITDEDLSEGLLIDMDSVRFDGEAAGNGAQLEKGENSFKVTIPEMDDDKTVAVTFDAALDAQKLAGSDVKNIAGLDADTDGVKEKKTAESDIKVKNRISTEIENGTITESIEDIEIGGERTVEYAPDEGYYIQKVIADGEEVKAEDPYEGSYTFSDIRKNHSIRVICELIPNLEILKETDKEQYHSDETVKYCIKARQTVEGAVAKNIVITDENLPEGLLIDMDSVKIEDETIYNVLENRGLRNPLSSHPYDLIPEDEGMIPAQLEKGENSFKVTIPEMDDDKTVAVTFDAALDAQKLAGSDVKNIAGLAADTDGVKEKKTAESDIKVKNRIGTEIENGTITESIEDIEIGGERTVEYAPDEGYYIQKVVVDGEEADTEEYKESYTFREIRENHEIEVKCIPIPDLAVTKETQSTRMQSADTMGYTIRTTQTVEGAVAENVEITDTNLPEGLVIDMDTIRVNDEAATIEKGDNEFTVHVPEIDDDKEVEITFDTCIDIETLEAGAVNNTVLVRCSTGGEVITAEDAREIEILNKIRTKVQNGSITESIDNIRIGETHTVEYTPDEGYCLKRILVDGREIEHTACENAYVFSDVRESHDIEVVYEPKETASDERHKKGVYIAEKAADTGDGFKPFCLIMLAAFSLIIICGVCLLARVEKDK